MLPDSSRTRDRCHLQLVAPGIGGDALPPGRLDICENRSRRREAERYEMEGGSLMNAMLGTFPTAEVRASDADRDAVLSDLSEHFQAGRLTAEEFEDRAGRALSARTWGELENLLRDLPSTLTGPQASVAVTSSAGRPERPSGRGAPASIALLAVIGIAVAVSVGIAHSGWGLLWVVLGLLIVRRLIRHAGTPVRCVPRG